MATAAIRFAIKTLKKHEFNSNVKELTGDEEDIEFKALAPCKVVQQRNVGITGRPSLIGMLKEGIRKAIGHDKNVFVAFNSKKSGETYFLLLKQADLPEGTDNILEGASFDNGFASDRGLNVLTAETTAVKQAEADDNQFLLYPPRRSRIMRDTFHLTFAGDDEGTKATIAYLKSIAVQE